jgi:bifunctional ADP-heptose synthase (sugar kinase/adenylyltransferase)
MAYNFLIIGEACTDQFVYGKISRLSPEAPVPIFNPVRTESNDGMAKNTFNNLLAIIRKENKNYIVNGIFSENCSTKIRYVDNKTNHYFLRVDFEDEYDRIDFNDVRQKIAEADCIIISDYNKGFLEAEDIEAIYKLKAISTPIFIDTKKKLDSSIIDWVDFIKLNQKEYEENVEDSIKKSLSEKLIVTLGEIGAFYNDKTYRSYSPKTTIDVSGAGDTFTAALAYRYMEDKSIESSIPFANGVAGEVVTKRGVCTI